MKLTRKERGFTLPELMVVILILALLLSVAIPVWIQARDRAITRAAQQRLANVVTASKMLRSEQQITFNSQTAAQLQAEVTPIQVTLSISGTPPLDGKTAIIYAQPVDGSSITFRAKDANSRIWEAVITASSGAVAYNGPF